MAAASAIAASHKRTAGKPRRSSSSSASNAPDHPLTRPAALVIDQFCIEGSESTVPVDLELQLVVAEALRFQFVLVGSEPTGAIRPKGYPVHTSISHNTRRQ